jgi:hypothetical protein
LLTNIVWVITFRIIRWTGLVVRMEERRGVYRVLVGKHENHLGYQGVDGRIILRWIFRKWHVGGVE